MMALLLWLLLQVPALTVTGNVEATGSVKASSFVLPDGSVIDSVDWTKIRVLTYLAGCDVCGVLSQFSDQRMIYQNLYGAPMQINEVRCYTDVDTAQVNLRRDDGTSAYILTSPLACSPSGAIATAFVAGEDMLQYEDKLDFDIVSTNGLAHGVTVVIKATIQ